MSDCIYNNLIMIMIVLFLAAPFAACGRARPERLDIGGTGRHAVIQRPRASFGTSGSRPSLCIVHVHVSRSPGGWLSSRGLCLFFTAWVSTFLRCNTTTIQYCTYSRDVIAPIITPIIIAILHLIQGCYYWEIVTIIINNNNTLQNWIDAVE